MSVFLWQIKGSYKKGLRSTSYYLQLDTISGDLIKKMYFR